MLRPTSLRLMLGHRWFGRSRLSRDGRGPDAVSCSSDTQQVVRVTWTGGVKLPDGEEPGDAERGLYPVTLQHTDGSSGEVSPTSLAELGDNDNNHFLCLDTMIPATAVTFPAGHLVDRMGISIRIPM